LRRQTSKRGHCRARLSTLELHVHARTRTHEGIVMKDYGTLFVAARGS
jgi:hypothetical protein